MTILQRLPVEILYDLHLFALSPSFPIVSSYFFNVFKNTSPFFKAIYIVACVEASGHSDLGTIYSRVLRYPICGRIVFEIICRLLKDRKSSPASPIQLPRRLFRALLPNEREWSGHDYPLPFLRDIYWTPNLPVIDTNANEGYALARAVHAQFTPLVKFLLDKGALPECRDGIALKIAIRSKNLEMLRMLVEGPLSIIKSVRATNSKLRSGKIKHRDRMALDSSMMKIAILSGANDIVEFYREKGVLPDIATLRSLVM